MGARIIVQTHRKKSSSSSESSSSRFLCKTREGRKATALDQTIIGRCHHHNDGVFVVMCMCLVSIKGRSSLMVPKSKISASFFG